MFNNPFIHARSAQDYVIGILIATHTAILTALFLVLASKAFN